MELLPRRGARPPGPGAALRRGRADAARGGGRALGGKLPAGDDRRGQARGDRRRARRRPARPRARRPGLDPGRVGAGRGAVRADDERDPLARPERLQRLGARLATSRSTATCARRCAASSKDAYAVTERDAGSDPSRIAATAERTDAGFRINGEKWFVTAGDDAAVYVVMANVIDGAERLPTLFVVDALARRDRDRRQPRLHPQLSRRPPDDPLHATSRSPRPT